MEIHYWGAHLTAKAYNAPVLVSWLSSCLDLALGRRVEEGRRCGQWIAESGLEWPDHELLMPSTVALTLVEIWYKKYIVWDVHKMPAFARVWGPLHLSTPRNALADNFWHVEASPRYLHPGKKKVTVNKQST